MTAMTVRHDQVHDHVDRLDLDVRIGSFFLCQNRGYRAEHQECRCHDDSHEIAISQHVTHLPCLFRGNFSNETEFPFLIPRAGSNIHPRASLRKTRWIPAAFGLSEPRNGHLQTSTPE